MTEQLRHPHPKGKGGPEHFRRNLSDGWSGTKCPHRGVAHTDVPRHYQPIKGLDDGLR